ncbi:MAG TPA: apolipoprotein N-acyltransferase [Kofleriaceae bacterium]|nr:apolipoprotein N-acyltransferase [Kofleriaceae bacterium]
MKRPRWLDLPGQPGPRATQVACAAAIVGGLLWTLAAPPIGLWPIAWLAALPTLWVIDQAPTRRRAGLYGGLTAVSFTVGGFHWLIHLLEVNAHLPAPVAVLGLGVLAALHGVVYLIGARLIRALRERRRDDPAGPWPMALCAPLGFAVIEIVLWTPFPFSMALTQAGVGPIRALSAAFGPAGITALMVAFAGGIYDVVTGRRRARWRVVAGVALFAVAMVLASLRRVDDTPASTVKIGIVQPNQPTEGVRGRGELFALREATDALAAQGAELVVWSEASLPFALDREAERDGAAGTGSRIRGKATVPIVVGALTVDDRGRAWNSAVLLAGDDHFAGRVDKIHRMIGSEYNPLIEWFPSTRSLMPQGAGSFEEGPPPVLLTADLGGHQVRIAIMICLEDVLPRFGRELAALEPDLIVNITNDTWFDTGAEPYQHEALARYRAVEMGVPMIRAVNTGPSSAIDRDGAFLGRTRVRGGGGHIAPDTLLVDVPIGGRAHSVYARWGGPLSWAIALGALGWWLLPGVFGWTHRKLRRRA